MRLRPIALASLAAMFLAWPARAFHVHVPNQNPTDNICAQQPLILGVDDVGGNTNLETAAHLDGVR